MTGRLINTDDLQIKIIYPRMCGKSIVVETVAEAIETILNNAPTVDAIPVEWLEAYATNLENKENANCYAYRGYAEGAEWIRSMIREWRENE